MKKYLSYITLIAALTTACSTTIDVVKKETITGTIPTLYYKDKIVLMNVENGELTDSELLRGKIANKISEFSLQGYDAVILRSKDISELMLTSSVDNQPIMNNIQSAAELAVKSGLIFFVEINFDLLNRTNFLPAQKTAVKNNFNTLVKNCEIDGFYFSGINFSSKDENNLFEDIVVESMLIKPFLIVSVPGKLNEKDYAFTDKYLEKGIIDFKLDGDASYSIRQNNYVSAREDQKVLNNYLKRISPNHFISLNLSEVIDKNAEEAEIVNERRSRNIDADLKLNFILTGKTDSVNLKIGNTAYNISTSDWSIPFNYLLNKDNTVSRYGTWVEFRRPFSQTTTNDIYNLLCKTTYPSEVTINDDSVKIYKTGVFFKKIKLKEGLNKLKAEAKDRNGETAIYEDRVLLVKQDPAKVDTTFVINDNQVEPAEDITLTPEDYLTVSFNGTKSQKGVVEISPGGFLFECSRTDLRVFSQYKVQIPLKKFSCGQQYNIKLVLKPSENSLNQKSVEKILKANISVKDYSDFPMLITISDNSIFNFTLSPIRLGAPVRNELPKNVILKSNGIFGEYYRVHLSEIEEGYINRNFVKEISEYSAAPSYFINSVTGSSTDAADIIRIPYLENVPYDIYPDPAQKRIVINLYGVKTSSTWIIHRNNLRYVDEITWQQTSKETYKIYINLKTSKIWGYDIKPNGKELIFRIKYPPLFNLESNLPLKGIKFSLEAGHGGSGIGAVGLSGLKEKEINLKLCKMLETLLKKSGADVLQIRDSDKDMSLIEKRDIAANSNANIHLSIHANSSEPMNEFLGTSGTCTFYHNPFWAEFSEKVYTKLLELELKPFGSVGSFNYRVTRMSDMPAILVEQAFMSHAEDEEKLYDDNFRQQMAEKIYNGIIDYLKYMKD